MLHWTPISSFLTIVRVKNKIKCIKFRGPLNSCNTLFHEEKDRPCPKINDKFQMVFDSKYNILPSEFYVFFYRALWNNYTTQVNEMHNFIN